ncbi:type VII secretion integral membrane protein EccD [Mycobacterium sp. Aquia_216]|uniref:type VII secretion integral membrane protein EccD n=1 Tax=Mycobacterium sp. Aquia_216 TaxID=2991729 RepID=UPI00227C982B|nr:type VII secretion integral membrane protein EccD [Mycobacterium sp. Aquia_216]WAJ46377.1 type VII secretion integral membrane protein EccD [Mycobacterium sp. Aquia_216]
MAVALSLTEPDLAWDDEQELSRITVVVGELLLDVGVPTTASVAALVSDVIRLANDQLTARGDSDVEFDEAEGHWTLSRLTGETIDPARSLTDAGVCDGEVLLVRQAGPLGPPPLVDDIEGVAESVGGGWFAEHGRTAAHFALGMALAFATVLLLRLPAATPSIIGIPITALAVLVVGIGCALVSFLAGMRSGDPEDTTWLASMGLLLIFGGSLLVVPGARGTDAVPMALALTALVALFHLITSRRGRSLYSAVVAIGVFGTPAALAQLLFHPEPRAIGTILTTVAVIMVYLAPRTTILLSRLPVPRVPTAGEPLDDIETQGGTAVDGVNAIGKQVIPTEEGMTEQVRRAREHLTGLVAAAAILAVIGCYLALDVSNEFYWQGTLFGVVVATVLCLRGRSHHDLLQSAVLIGGGLVIGLVLIVKTATFVDGWRVNAAIALVALTVLMVLCGLVAPQVDFSPVLRRRVEMLEYVAIGMVFPLACSIIRLYTLFRGLRI